MSHNTARLINVVKFGCSIMLATCLVSQNANAGKNYPQCQGNKPVCEAGMAAMCTTMGAYRCVLKKVSLCVPTTLKCKNTQTLICKKGVWSCQ